MTGVISVPIPSQAFPGWYNYGGMVPPNAPLS